jgi:DNA mismatch repair ATPase MutL
MTDDSRRIGRLDQHTAASVRGSQVIGSVSRAIEELLHNAVDGCAKSCIISVGTSEITVCDDGIGIDPDAMRLFIGTEYCSNNGVDTGRKKGESLRSIASLCVEMKIETSCWWKSNDSNIRNSNASFGARKLVRSEKVFRGGSVVFFNQCHDGNNSQSAIIPTVGKSKEMMSGTTITLRGLFHQHAVRRKSMEGGSNSLELNRIGSSLRLLALSYPRVAFQLKDQSTGNLVASYGACSETSRSSLSAALRFRLCEMYPNDFNDADSIEVSHDTYQQQQTGYNAFGVVSIVRDDANNVSMRNRELEVVCINGRLATEAVRLPESVLSQIRRWPGVNPSEIFGGVYVDIKLQQTNCQYSFTFYPPF